MSYGNLAIIFMVVLVAVCGVGGVFVATYYLNKAVRQRDAQPGTASADSRSRIASVDIRPKTVTIKERKHA